MYTKNLIQEQLENQKNKLIFKEGINMLLDKYLIEDNIFLLKDSELKEVINGYFVINKEYNNINEALSGMDINNMCIRIIESKKFQIGNIYKTLSECPDNTNIFDVSSNKDVR